jgi:hypothetical protein
MAQKDRTLDTVFKFPHIARPVVISSIFFILGDIRGNEN